MNEPHERYRQYLESLTPESLGRLEEHVAEGVRFRDPEKLPVIGGLLRWLRGRLAVR